MRQQGELAEEEAQKCLDGGELEQAGIAIAKAKGGMRALRKQVDQNANDAQTRDKPEDPKAPISLEPDAPLVVLKEGWLLKQSKKLKMWQKRYFVLDNVALYYCSSPVSMPDGFFPIRKCQFLVNEETCSFDVITPSRVFRMQCPEGAAELAAWTTCYKSAMSKHDFPYFHVEQTTMPTLSRELLLGVMSRGIRLVKLGLYDPGHEEEIAFFRFLDLDHWKVVDLDTFQFKVADERFVFSFRTMHAQQIDALLQARHERWKTWKTQQTPTQGGLPDAASSFAPRAIFTAASARPDSEGKTAGQEADRDGDSDGEEGGLAGQLTARAGGAGAGEGNAEAAALRYPV